MVGLLAFALGVGGLVVGGGVQDTSATWTDAVNYRGLVSTMPGSSPPKPGGEGGLNPGPNTTFPAGTPAWTQVGLVNGACVTVSVTSASTSATAWSLVLDTASSPWNGATSGFQLPWQYGLSGGLVDGRYLTIVGTHADTKTVQAGKVLPFEICNWGIGVPPIGPAGSHTITVSPVTVEGNKACKTITATALGTTRFLFRWQIAVPTADMFAALPAGGTFGWSYSDYNVKRNPENPSTNPATPPTITFSSATNDATTMLSGTKVVTFTECLTRY